MAKVKYIDTRPMTLNLRSSQGRSFKLETGKTYEATDAELRALLKRKNGSKPCFEQVNSAARRRESVGGES